LRAVIPVFPFFLKKTTFFLSRGGVLGRVFGVLESGFDARNQHEEPLYGDWGAEQQRQVWRAKSGDLGRWRLF
jgi:hypothetical protein